MSNLWIQVTRVAAARDDPEQFFHGSWHEYSAGDSVVPGKPVANRIGHGSELAPRPHVYFTGDVQHAADFSDPDFGHVYQVAPTGKYEDDPEDKGNSYRSRSPLTVIRKVPGHIWNGYGED